MTGRYAAAVERIGWLLDGVEKWFQSLPDGFTVRRSNIRVVVPGRRATDDEIVVALTALCEVGGVERVGDAWRFNRPRFEQSASYRRGVRDALRYQGTFQQSDRVVVVAALPPSLDQLTRSLVLREASDLRAAVLDLIASAQDRIILASPFWDEETVDDLQRFLEKRIAAGARVSLLGRAVGGSTASGNALKMLADRLDPTACRAVGWFRSAPEDPLGAETFHFKLAIADSTTAYLGTANFTTSGLRSRMELGVVATGEIAGRLARIFDSVIGW